MSIVVSCRECDTSYKLPVRYAGKRCRCKACKAKIKVPAGTPMESEPKKMRERQKVTAGLVEAKPERPARKRKKKSSQGEKSAKPTKQKPKKALGKRRKARNRSTQRLESSSCRARVTS